MWIGKLTGFNSSEHLESCVELVLDKEVKSVLFLDLSLPAFVHLVVLANQFLHTQQETTGSDPYPYID